MKHRLPAVHLATGAYASSGAHLRDELARVDLLIRAQVIHWQLTIGTYKPENLWGMVHVTGAEIAHYLGADVAPPDFIPEEVLEVTRHFDEAEEEIAECIRKAVEPTPADVDLRVIRLAKTFQLNNDVERDILLLCLLPELDVRYRRIYGYLQDDASRAHPSVEIISQIVLRKAGSLEAVHELLLHSQPLLRNRLLVPGGQEGRSSRFLGVDDRIVSFLLGSDEPDERLKGIVSVLPLESWDAVLASSELLDQLRQFAEATRGRAAQAVLHGPYGSGKQKAARAIATQQRRPLISFEVEAAIRRSQWEETVDLGFREARLLNAAIYVHRVERLFEEDQPPHLWEYLLEAAQHFDGLTFFAATAMADSSGRSRDAQLQRFDFPVPNFDLRRQIWSSALERERLAVNPDAIVPTLAAAFQITEGQVADAVAAALAAARLRSFSDPRISSDDLYAACRKQAGRRLIGFARRIEPTRQLTLDDVILSKANKAQVRELLNRIRLRSRVEKEMNFERKMALGQGLVALLAGAPGTGKTLTAELIANQQGIDLYKVDVSAIVSKWVGQTEKNLSRIFAEAEDSDALLFFDECDSLFGQRGDTASEASGRWANLQVNYLLSRIEEYAGVVVLATNLRKNIDEAFIRRIQVIIDFTTPDAALRLQIWKRTLPGAANGLSDADLEAVAARFALTGGNVRNACIDAAFRALAAGRDQIVLRDLVDSIAREYQKVGKPITQGEFGAEFYAWVLADILAPAGG
jgi:ATP-dependent 26S proteasome regulatory subunit